MSNMRSHGKSNSLLVQGFSCRTPPYATTVLPARMFGNERLASTWTLRIQFSNTNGETIDVLLIEFRAPKHGSATLNLPLSRISFAFAFSLFQCLIFHKETLPFVSPACVTPFQHYRGKA